MNFDVIYIPQYLGFDGKWHFDEPEDMAHADGVFAANPSQVQLKGMRDQLADECGYSGDEIKKHIRFVKLHVVGGVFVTADDV